MAIRKSNRSSIMQMNVYEQFWMVVCMVPGGSGPTVRHPTEESAKAEAARMCQLHNKPFGVMVLTNVVTPAAPPVAWSKAG